jgi:Cysteine/serine-rich nuclear protein N-terminus
MINLDSASTSTTPSDFCSAPHEPLPPTATPERSSLKRRGEAIADGCTSPKAKKKRSLSFQSVTVYYFPRAQGFTCVPSQVREARPFAHERLHLILAPSWYFACRSSLLLTRRLVCTIVAPADENQLIHNYLRDGGCPKSSSWQQSWQLGRSLKFVYSWKYRVYLFWVVGTVSRLKQISWRGWCVQSWGGE